MEIIIDISKQIRKIQREILKGVKLGTVISKPNKKKYNRKNKGWKNNSRE